MSLDEYKRFERLTFDDFRRMAADESLSRYEKIGFPNAYREGKEEAIWRDIEQRMAAIQGAYPGGRRMVLAQRSGDPVFTSYLVENAELVAVNPGASRN